MRIIVALSKFCWSIILMLISKVSPRKIVRLDSYLVSEGDRIAQLVLEKIYTPSVVEVNSLSATERGVGGFGSTGK